MEVPNNPSEQAVWIARLKVCSTFGPLGNAAGSTPPPAIGAWLRAHLPTNGFYTAHIIPSESAVLNLVSSHCELISANPKYSIGMSLMMLAYSAAKLLEIGATRLVDNTELMKKTIDLVLPALTDGRLEFIAEPLGGTLNVLIPQVNKAEQLIHEHIIRTTYPVMVENLQPSTEKTLRHMVKYWEKILERPPGRMAYESVFIDSSTYSLGKILLSAQNARPTYSERTADHLNSALCISICTFIGVADQQKLASFMNQICFGPPAVTANTANGSPTETELPTPTSSAPEPTPNPASVALRNALRSVFRSESPAPRVQSETGQQSANSESKPGLLIYVTLAYSSPEVSERMLSTLIGVCGDTPCSPLILREMCRLADAHSGSDHKQLFPAAVSWFSACVDNLSNPEVLEKLEEGQLDGNLAPQIESACVLLSYLTDALHAINTSQSHSWRSISPTWESPSDLGFDFEYNEEQQDEEDTSADDSDEDTMLQYKLCTFTVTQREFMNQHWYHCHTCKMVDGVGVCTVCARVCHRGHDVSYAKFGNFFCDCGAKPDSSCQALVKRSVTLGGARGAGAEDAPPAPSLRRRPSSPTPPTLLAMPRRPVLANNIQGCRQFLTSYNGWSQCMERVRRVLDTLSAPVKAACERNAPTGAHGRAQRALAQLHLGEKKFTHTDNLMQATLGSQEGAFENVRMSYTGENGQTIRQLMSAHKLRRVAMCCLASPQGRRQHLAVSHEKGKITVLQLSALLKQADSSKHKLTLTRLSSAPIPFTVLSLSGNPWNEDLLAVCGLKECHVLTFNSGGAVADHLVLTTGLEANNYIIKAIWLPGSQTQLALVTSDFVKIFDLSRDCTSPMHHFLVPSGKVSLQVDLNAYHIAWIVHT
ncbi:putative ubiquitin protein ligase E3 component n-recognin 4, partial [Operophtera brumata]